MFAVVRTGGKQYRVAAGDKIVVEKMTGNAGDTVSLGDVLFAADGSEAKAVAGLAVSAEIIAQAKADKIIVFKKKRRHNYRRKAGHRQQHTILKILSVGAAEKKAAPKKHALSEVEGAKAAPAEAVVETKAAKPAKEAAPKKAAAPKAEAKPAAKKPAAKKADAAK
jgi:large subunit ribosomal protein L21